MKTSICVNCLEAIYYGTPKDYDPEYKYAKAYTPPVQWYHENTNVGSCAMTRAEPIKGSK